jgi:hypothetical protein
LPSGFLISPGIMATGVTGDPIIYLPSPATVVTLSQTNVTFGNQPTGTPSAVNLITLTNVGANSLVISGIAIAGSNASDYSETDTCTGFTLLGGGKCTIDVVFTPGATGASSATLSVTDNGGASPQTILLSGTGT